MTRPVCFWSDWHFTFSRFTPPGPRKP